MALNLGLILGLSYTYSQDPPRARDLLGAAFGPSAPSANLAELLGEDRSPAALRRFISEHSVHQIDAEHERYAFDRAEVARRIRLHAEGKGDPPHLSCGPRAFALAALAREVGLEARIVSVLRFTEDEQLDTHTLAELRAAPDQPWAIQDPDYELEVLGAKGEPVGATRVLLTPLSELAPRGLGAARWTVQAPFWGALLIDRRPERQRSVILVNTRRLDLTPARRAKLREAYGDPEIVELP